MYIATVLTADSQKYLAELMHHFSPIPEDWTIHAHHMTVEFSKAKAALEPGYFPDGINLGMPVVLMATHWKRDERGFAVKVKSDPDNERLRVSNKIPHITIAVAPGVKPFYSNQLLENGEMFEIDSAFRLDAHLVYVQPFTNQLHPNIDVPMATDPFNRSTNR